MQALLQQLVTLIRCSPMIQDLDGRYGYLVDEQALEDLLAGEASPNEIAFTVSDTRTGAIPDTT